MIVFVCKIYQVFFTGLGLRKTSTYKETPVSQTESIGQGEKVARWESLTNGSVGNMLGGVFGAFDYPTFSVIV
jgi:hypothetical protein